MEAAEPHPTAAAFRRGVRDALKLPAWIIGLTMMGIGPLARDVGYPFLGAVLTTGLVWAGPAQVVFLTMLGAGASLGAIAFAVALTAIRLLPMAAAMTPFLRHGAPRPVTLLAASHFTTVTVWTEMMRRLPDVAPADRRPYYFGFSLACITLGMSLTAVGYLLAGAAPPALGAGLLFATPAFFLLSLMGGARLSADWLAIGAGLALTPLFGLWLGPGGALFLAGVGGGTAAFLWQRRMAGSG